jgi:hypothetical protein
MMATKIVITLDTEKENETPEHSEKVTHSAPGYAKAVREIMKTAEGRWGWCTVRVTAKVGKSEATSYLGNCSYKNAEDFIAEGGYFEQMAREAVEEASEKEKVAKALTKQANAY